MSEKDLLLIAGVLVGMFVYNQFVKPVADQFI